MKKEFKEKILKILMISILPLLQMYLTIYFRLQYERYKIKITNTQGKIEVKKENIKQQENTFALRLSLLESQQSQISLLKENKEKNKENIEKIIQELQENKQKIEKISEDYKKSFETLKTVQEELKKINTNKFNSHIRYLIISFTVPFLVFLGNFLITKLSKSVMKRKILLKITAIIIIYLFVLLGFSNLREIKQMLEKIPSEKITENKSLEAKKKELFKEK
ncbi:hypothetical protein PA0590 [Candidatus Phytoplasma australiense]|uniref:Uncharacterized protein n=1 Tax=Phytoplasma australiense TaxID=59748 RepID=B1VAF1_PHYAS|nr:hypothetical protein PA0590 [Candidatus Phytoplasma australiense]